MLLLICWRSSIFRYKLEYGVSAFGNNSFVAPSSNNPSLVPPNTPTGAGAVQTGSRNGVSDAFSRTVCGLGSAAGTYASNSQAANNAWGAAGATNNNLQQQALAFADKKLPDIASSTEAEIRKALAEAGVEGDVTEEVVRVMMDGDPKSGAAGITETAGILREQSKQKYAQAVSQPQNQQQMAATLKATASDVSANITSFQKSMINTAVSKAETLQTKKETTQSFAEADTAMAASPDENGQTVSAKEVLPDSATV